MRVSNYLQIFHNSGSESFNEVCQWSPTANKSFWLVIMKPIWFNPLITIANFRFLSVRDFNVTVLLLCELYTGFLQRINQFSSSVKFANGYYENQLTDSKRWWYFYICQKFTYDRWITYLWLFVDFRATITSNFTGYRNTQNRQIYRTM